MPETADPQRLHLIADRDDTPEAWLDLARALLAGDGLEPGEGPQYAKAVTACSRALIHAPDHVEALYLRGISRRATFSRSFFDDDSCSGALADLSRVVALSPNWATGWRERGRTRNTPLQMPGGQPNTDEIANLDDLTIATGLAPDDALSWRYRAYSERNLGMLRAAVTSLGRWLALEPTHRGFVARARLQRDLGELQLAVDDYRASIAIPTRTSEEWQLQLEMGKVLRDAGRLDEARTAFERALALLPESTEAPKQIAEIAALQKTPDAEQWADRASVAQRLWDEAIRSGEAAQRYPRAAAFFSDET